MKMKWSGIFFIVLAVCLALCNSLQAAEPLPDTGQTKCFGSGGEINPCPVPGTAFYGQDAHYTRERSYTKLDEYQIKDNITGLIWEIKSDDGSINDRDNKYSWDNAQSVFIASLNSDSGYCGKKNWRLPTVKELSRLTDYSCYNPIIDIAYFPQTQPRLYWSSTTVVFETNDAWAVNFSEGSNCICNKTDDDLYVRAVRSEQ